MSLQISPGLLIVDSLQWRYPEDIANFDWIGIRHACLAESIFTSCVRWHGMCAIEIIGSVCFISQHISHTFEFRSADFVLAVP